MRHHGTIVEMNQILSVCIILGPPFEYCLILIPASVLRETFSNASAGGAAASEAALSVTAASALLALAPGTLGCARHLLLSMASATVSTFSLLRQAFLVHLC